MFNALDLLRAVSETEAASQLAQRELTTLVFARWPDADDGLYAFILTLPDCGRSMAEATLAGMDETQREALKAEATLRASLRIRDAVAHVMTGAERVGLDLAMVDPHTVAAMAAIELPAAEDMAVAREAVAGIYGRETVNHEEDK
jgi:hypothetical protein